MHITCENGWDEVLEFLLEKNQIPVCYYDREDKSALILALENNHLELARILLLNGAGLFERFSNNHSEALLSLNFEAYFFLGATLDGKDLNKQHALFNSQKNKEESSNPPLNKEIIRARLLEVLNSDRCCRQVVILLGELTKNKGNLSIEESLSLYGNEIELSDKLRRDEALKNLKERIELLKNIIQILDEAIEQRTNKLTSRYGLLASGGHIGLRWVLPIAAFILFFISAIVIGAHIFPTGSAYYPLFILSFIGAAVSIIGLVLCDCCMPNLKKTPAELKEMALQIGFHQLQGWKQQEKNLLDLARLVLEESKDEALKGLANKLVEALGDKKLTMFALKNLVEALGNYYTTMHSSLLGDRHAEIPLINPLSAIRVIHSVSLFGSGERNDAIPLEEVLVETPSDEEKEEAIHLLAQLQ